MSAHTDHERRLQRYRVVVKLLLLLALVAIVRVFLAQPGSRGGSPAEIPELRVDLSDITPGSSRSLVWEGRPVIVVRFDEALRTGFDQDVRPLSDPASRDSEQPAAALNRRRSVDAKWFVAIALGTDLSCVVEFVANSSAVDPRLDTYRGKPWAGGFRDTCRGSYYDLAGRVYADQAATRNLPVPPHHFDGDTLVLGSE